VAGSLLSQRDAPAVQEVAEVDGQDVNGHVEAHAIRRAGIAASIEAAHREVVAPTRLRSRARFVLLWRVRRLSDSRPE